MYAISHWLFLKNDIGNFIIVRSAQISTQVTIYGLNLPFKMYFTWKCLRYQNGLINL